MGNPNPLKRKGIIPKIQDIGNTNQWQRTCQKWSTNLKRNNFNNLTISILSINLKKRERKKVKTKRKNLIFTIRHKRTFTIIKN